MEGEKKIKLHEDACKRLKKYFFVCLILGLCISSSSSMLDNIFSEAILIALFAGVLFSFLLDFLWEPSLKAVSDFGNIVSKKLNRFRIKPDTADTATSIPKNIPKKIILPKKIKNQIISFLLDFVAVFLFSFVLAVLFVIFFNLIYSEKSFLIVLYEGLLNLGTAIIFLGAYYYFIFWLSQNDLHYFLTQMK